MDRRKLLAVAIAVATGAFACTAAPTGPPAPTAPPPASPEGPGPAPASPAATGQRPIELGWLPPQGVLVQRNGAVVLVSLAGRVLARVPGATLTSGSQAPGRTLVDVEGVAYELDLDADALVRWRGDPTATVPDDRRVPLPTPAAPDGRPMAGHWRFARLAVDGNHILAQWSGECEVPVTYLMTLQDGDPVPVTGPTGSVPESFALGWTRSTRAIVVLPSGACGASVRRPGVYAFTAPGVARFVTWVPDRVALARMWGASGQALPA